MAGIGPATSPLPRECSTTEPHGRLTNKPSRLERATRFELATSCLEGKCSTNWATPAYLPLQLKRLQAQSLLKTLFYTNWWRGKDSNLRTLRERIYSPSPLTTRPPLLTEPAIMLIIWLAVKCIKGNLLRIWCRMSESNWRPSHYKCAALPTELIRR